MDIFFAEIASEIRMKFVTSLYENHPTRRNALISRAQATSNSLVAIYIEIFLEFPFFWNNSNSSLQKRNVGF